MLIQKRAKCIEIIDDYQFFPHPLFFAVVVAATFMNDRDDDYDDDNFMFIYIFLKGKGVISSLDDSRSHSKLIVSGKHL